MIKRNGQRIAAIAMAVALIGQNAQFTYALENLTETVTIESEATTTNEVSTEETTKVESETDKVEEESLSSTE